MCGIAGLYNTDEGPSALQRRIDAMAAAMHHRGPDEAGCYVSKKPSAALACARLSIMDPIGGTQPIANEDRSVFVVCNGEIYNHKELRKQLTQLGHRFATGSDAEAVVHAYEQWGEDCIERLEGMFGLAVLDTRADRLLLARDRMGIKPLYLAKVGAGWVFASEIGAVHASGLVAREPDHDALALCMSVGWTPAPQTCFAGVEKLDAGEMCVMRGSRREGRKYWTPQFAPSIENLSDDEWAERLDGALAGAVRTHLAADVDVGAFVSGGADSSLVASYAHERVGDALQTFSLVFPDDPSVDESRFSRAVARSLGTRHAEIELRAGDVPDLLPSVTQRLEEPLVTAPVVALYQLATLASRSVKTVLSGEGADELFAGYPWLLEEGAYRLRPLVPQGLASFAAGVSSRERVRRWLGVLAAKDEGAADIEAIRFFRRDERDKAIPGLAGLGDESLLRSDELTTRSADCRLERRLGFEITRRLSNGILNCVDKMSMANSLEVRVPFLDAGVVDLAMSMPASMKVRNGREKHVISLLSDRLPPEVAARRKFGLHYPLSKWLAGPLHSYAREILLDPSSDGLINRELVARNFDSWASDHSVGARRIWALLVLRLWHRANFE